MEKFQNPALVNNSDSLFEFFPQSCARIAFPIRFRFVRIVFIYLYLFELLPHGR